MITSIDGFYKIVHLGVTILVVGFILYIWVKYSAISPDKNEKTSNSLLYFSAALVLWEYNLFDTDYQYEIYSTIIVNGLLLMGITYFNHGVLMTRTNSPYRAVKSVPVVSILLLLNEFKNDQTNLQTVLLLANQLTALNTSRLRGLVNNDEYQTHRSSIAARILILVKKEF